MSLLFVPPKQEEKTLPRFGSYVVGSGLKVHSRLVDAKNSFNYRGWTYSDRKRVTKHSYILENVDGRWYTLYEIAPGLTFDELPWVKTFIRDTNYRWDSGQLLDDFNKMEYYVNLRKENPNRFVEYKKKVPMSRDEYVAWRLAIQKEQFDSIRDYI